MNSYKLWYRYLRLRRVHSRSLCPGSILHEETNNAHERALVTMHKVLKALIYLPLIIFFLDASYMDRLFNVPNVTRIDYSNKTCF